eukprot:884689-Pyramimonas_sp.AAC.1
MGSTGSAVLTVSHGGRQRFAGVCAPIRPTALYLLNIEPLVLGNPANVDETRKNIHKFKLKLRYAVCGRGGIYPVRSELSLQSLVVLPDGL